MHHLGLALGGRPGQSFARRLLLPVSNDTLLRVVRRRAVQPPRRPRVVGIDDFAWKRGHRYGTIICDLERRRIIDILPDREAATATAWLADHPSITVIARDRGAGYKQAAAEGRPDAVQVADRWHLMENASAAFLTAVQRSMAAIRKAVSAGTVDPEALSAAERRQHTGWLRREAENADILALAARGVAIKEIMRRTDKSRGLVRQVVRGGRADIFRSRMSSLDPFLTQLETAWADGSQNGAALWRAMKTRGFTGSLRVVTEWATRKRKDEGTATRDKAAQQDAIGPPHRPHDDDWSATRCRKRRPDGRDHRSGCAGSDHGTRSARPLSSHDPAPERQTPGRVAGGCKTGSDGFVRFRHRSGPRGGESGADRTMVERSDRGAEHEAETGEAPDVWPSQSRPAACPSYRGNVMMTDLSTKIASEPFFHAE